VREQAPENVLNFPLIRRYAPPSPRRRGEAEKQHFRLNKAKIFQCSIQFSAAFYKTVETSLFRIKAPVLIRFPPRLKCNCHFSFDPLETRDKETRACEGFMGRCRTWSLLAMRVW
jgi:hypothetical protein